MEETYCLKDKRNTRCVEPSGYQRDKRGRLQFYVNVLFEEIKKVRYVKENGQVGTGKKTGKGRSTKN